MPACPQPANRQVIAELFALLSQFEQTLGPCKAALTVRPAPETELNSQSQHLFRKNRAVSAFSMRREGPGTPQTYSKYLVSAVTMPAPVVCDRMSAVLDSSVKIAIKFCSTAT